MNPAPDSTFVGMGAEHLLQLVVAAYPLIVNELLCNTLITILVRRKVPTDYVRCPHLRLVPSFNVC